MKKDLLTIRDVNAAEATALIDRALEMKKEGRGIKRSLAGYTLGLLFDKTSTRTRVSFESAMFRLGGQTLFLSPADTQLSRDESIADTARVLSRYLDVLAVRTYAHEWVEEMARWAEIPVINALTDRYHPCQVLSDLMTIKEKKASLGDLRVAWVGDGNNVAQSWINAAGILGFELVLACPRAHYPPAEALEDMAPNTRLTEDPREAVRGADVINTDVWVSMGQEDQRAERVRDFAGFQVDHALVELAKPDVLVLHCLPAHRGEEISADVLEGPHSVVFDQAENKMHLHQALLEKLLADR
jgi:ornithine carbamoyltransferase